MKQRVSRILAVLLPVLLLSATGIHSFAQTSRGAVSGAVSDPTGAVVVGAFVTLTNIETSVTRTTTSGNEGLYRFEAVEPGAYAVKITARDLDESTQTDVIVTANQTALVVTQLKWSTKPHTVYVTVESGPLLLALLLPFESQSHVLAQSSPIDTTIASQYFQEAQTLCSRDQGRLWGVSLCGPMLFVDPKTRAVVANQADREDLLAKTGTVFIGTLPAKVNTANTATDWAGVKWTMIIFPLPEDKYRRANLMAHELWHRIQNEIGFPSSGAANNHLDSRDGRVWLQLEWRALAAALTSHGKQLRQAVADALLFRASRRAIFPQAAAQEREMEMHEGLAEYTGVKLSGSPNLDQYVVDGDLKDVAGKKTFVRSFAYASGPAYGVLLDETDTNWRKNLKKEDDLGSLLQASLAIKLPGSIKSEAEKRARIYDGEKLLASETELDNNRQKILATYRAQLVDGPVLMVPLQKMSMQFNPGNLVPLDSLGTVYPNIRIVDVWGILTVSKGALMNPTFSRIYVAAPNRLGVSPLQGEGWTLELNAGWIVAAGERKGDFVVKEMSN
jgi:hypothetical protein